MWPELRAAIDRLNRLIRENAELKRQLVELQQALRDARGN
jgi:uncharacterized protein (UPF0335 family)